MRHTLLILFLLATAHGLCAQGGKIEFTYDEPLDGPGREDIDFVPEPGTGRFAMTFPLRLIVGYSDSIRANPLDEPVTRRLDLIADSAVVWVEPQAAKGQENAPTPANRDDAWSAMQAGVKTLQLYGEGHVWMRYTRGRENLTVRADRVYLEFTRKVVRTFNEKGEEKTHTVLEFKGHMQGVKAHTGSDDITDTTAAGPPLGVGVGLGNAADDARDPERQKSVGAAPNESAVPEARGKPSSLPQERGQRLFLRAKEFRFASLDDEQQIVEIEHGSVSSSSLAVASYSLAAEAITIRITPVRQTLYITRPSIRILDLPLLNFDIENYAYDLDSSPPIRQLNLGNSSQYGYWIRTYIDAAATYDFLRDPEPPFHPVQIGPQVDWFSKRGLGLGANMDWGSVRAFETFGRATFRSYYIKDRGDQRQRARELGWFPLENNDRGRVLGAYSQNFGAGWQLDNLFNYESDANFRREFYEREYDNNEPLDSYIMLTKRSGPLNFFLLLQPRVHPWRNQTEYLPTIGFDVSRAAVGDFGLQLSSHSEVSLLHFRPTEDDPRRTISVPRAYTATWFNLPLDLGFLALDPYAGIHATTSTSFLEIPGDGPRPGLSDDGTFPGIGPGQQRLDGLLYRLMPFFGANAQTFFTGTFPDVKIPWMGIDGLRHVFAPFARYRNVAWNTLDDIPDRAFVPMDGVDVLDEFHEIRVGFRNMLQTRTGKGRDRRTTDYFEVMMELPLYPNYRRDNDGKFYGDMEIAATWRPAPGFALAGQMFLDPLSGNINRAYGSFRFDILSVGQANLYYRLLKGRHQVVGVQGDLTLSESYGVRAKQEYDLQSGEFLDTRIEITRRVLESIDIGFVFVRDAVENDIGFYVSISLALQAPKGGSALLR